ncbi:MAG: hypothetical protein FJX55_06675 [Alphaproteobacteria bacterium]|nr:hypothetical protein [Alphaproteobacteria bacterium]
MPGPILVHSLDHAHAALAAAAALSVPVTLASAPGAAGYAGPAWFGEVIAAARHDHPSVEVTAVLDCGDAPGHVMAAVRWAMKAGGEPFVLRFTGDPARDKALSEIASAAGLRLIRDLEPSLDLRRVRNPDEACRAWLAGVAAAP